MFRRLLAVSLALVLLNLTAAAAPDAAAFDQAERSAAIAGHSLSKVHRWLHEIALPKIDPETGLYIADGKWNYRDTAADCYPFLTWAAWAVDQDALNGPVRSVLHNERRLCNVLGRIPAPYDFKAKKSIEIAREELVFQASEYVKDGLIAIIEVTGRDEWFDRMREIEDDLWAYADIETPFGLIPSKNIEVNGEQIQALARLYTMTGDARYLDWAERLADYYLSQEDWIPQRLRDHGCEIIGGLGLLLGVESVHRPKKAQVYEPRIREMLDTVIEKGCTPDGMMVNRIAERNLDRPYANLSDGWGYNYVSYLCYDIVVGEPVYRDHIVKTLQNLAKPQYTDYRWERESIDGFADSIEGALYLLNRLPVAEGLAWVDRETVNNLVDHPTRLENGELWGTMKLQANGVRTTLIHALMHTRGILARPWRQGLELGAAPRNDGVAVVVRPKDDYRGHLEFDLPRHRVYMGFRHDWPRMNTLPEWFTVEPEQKYTVRAEGAEKSQVYTGRQLHNGLAIKVKSGETLRLIVTPQ
ncbi:MAG: hypothetical protein GWP08_01060 [Nitrospiraceae bacterium]|nr:hypothetical protein [Nitrospiraceae bacterium]